MIDQRKMGVEYYLIRDDVREIYDLGKWTHNWARLIADPDGEAAAARGGSFTICQDAGVIADRLRRDWAEERMPVVPRYLELVAIDLIRWAGTSLVRCSTDCCDGWRNADGSWDDGRITGSRHSNEHPEWPELR